jgi:hypothetical protein
MTVRTRHAGIAGVELLIALPILLFLGLGALQFALVFHARHALTFALTEAARAGSVAHADPQAIRSGLAGGLVPWLYGAQDVGEYVLNVGRARAHVVQGEALGWIRLERVSPTPTAFDDWAEPARDANGGVLDGTVEIPNDNLAVRALRTLPASGTAGSRSGEPIGATSGLTLNDANLLRLRMEYGVPLVVPVAGRLIAWAMRAWDGCEVGRARRYGALELDAPPIAPAPPIDACVRYGLPGAQPRLPVRIVATVRMQSPARTGG